MDGLLRAIKIRSTSSFGWEVKPSALCCKILQHVKEITSKYGQIYFGGQIHNFLLQVPPDLLLDDSAGMIVRELWWTNQFSRHNSTMVLLLICHLGNEQ
jgi:hypothetical protein